MTAQDVVNSVSQDIRSQLAASGSDANILLDYVDRIHKDALHSSLYAYLNEDTSSVTTIAGTSSYAISGSARRIRGVYDRTQERPLLDFDEATGMFEQEEATPEQQQPLTRDLSLTFKGLLGSNQPEFYRHIGSSIYFYPSPQQTRVYEIHFEKNIATLAGLSTTLTIPDDGKDMMVAGVNAMAFMFLLKGAEADKWMGLYQKLKSGESLS